MTDCEMLTAWVYPTASRRSVWVALVGVLGDEELPGLDLLDVEDAIREEVEARCAPAQVRYVPASRTLSVWYPEDDEVCLYYHPTWIYLDPLNFPASVGEA